MPRLDVLTVDVHTIKSGRIAALTVHPGLDGRVSGSSVRAHRAVHSTPGASPAELRAWIQAAVPAAVTTHHVFDFRVTRLEHDPAFVADMLRGLEETWAGVVAARANPGLCAAASAVQPSLGFAFKNFSKSFKNG